MRVGALGCGHFHLTIFSLILKHLDITSVYEIIPYFQGNCFMMVVVVFSYSLYCEAVKLLWYHCLL